MTNIDINSEYPEIIQREKKFQDKSINFPAKGEYITLNIKDNKDTEYIYDITRNRATLYKCTYQERHHISIQLLRLDIDNRLHHNPDDTVVSGNHIYVYSDNYGDKYAFELDDPILNKINPYFDLNRFNIDINKIVIMSI